MTCARPHCGGLIVERHGINADGPYLQRICSACSRGVTIPLHVPYEERTRSVRTPLTERAPRIKMSPDEKRERKCQSENKTRTSRYERGLCARSGCPQARADGKTQCQPHLTAMAVYALARYHRLKKLKRAAKT